MNNLTPADIKRISGRWEDLSGLWLEIDERGYTKASRGDGGIKHSHVSTFFIYRYDAWILETSAPSRIYGRANKLGQLVLRFHLMRRFRRLFL